MTKPLIFIWIFVGIYLTLALLLTYISWLLSGQYVDTANKLFLSLKDCASSELASINDEEISKILTFYYSSEEQVLNYSLLGKEHVYYLSINFDNKMDESDLVDYFINEEYKGFSYNLVRASEYLCLANGTFSLSDDSDVQCYQEYSHGVDLSMKYIGGTYLKDGTAYSVIYSTNVIASIKIEEYQVSQKDNPVLYFLLAANNF